MKYYSTKTYGNDRGLSCCFRQWRANSHCNLLHGYSLGIKLIFETNTLDDRNWVMDFGGLSDFKQWAEHMFDHTLVISEDDPALAVFQELSKHTPKLFDLRIVPAVGCEKFARLCYDQMHKVLREKQDKKETGPYVRLKSVEVFEHAGNSAIYEG